ncbi:hypothetical protein [Streptosporangium sp. NPDC000396]|uniref:hypothetical protein n=1 Tax=Streptosporangium sp. NPDC000396 TaxID=3366185 RepID=UPI00369C22B1
MSSILEAVALTKRSGSVTAVKEVTLTVRGGEIVGLLGLFGWALRYARAHGKLSRFGE